MTQQDVRDLGARIDALLDELEGSAPPAIIARVEELLRAVIGLYGAGLERVVALLRDDEHGESRVRRLAADDLVASLLLLHDLHPDDVRTRIQQALDRVRPYLGSHAGGVEFLGVDADGVARLQLEGSCDGCPSSAVTVQLAIEQAVLDAAPEVVRVEVEGMVSTGPKLLQIQPLHRTAGAGAGSAAATGAGDGDGWHPLRVGAAPGHVEQLTVADVAVLVCNLGGAPYAYRDTCPTCGVDLSGGALFADVLRCAGCAGEYDVRLAGRALAGAVANLEPLPLLPDGDGWRVALPQRVMT